MGLKGKVKYLLQKCQLSQNFKWGVLRLSLSWKFNLLYYPGYAGKIDKDFKVFI